MTRKITDPNSMCLRCTRKCKQAKSTRIISCPKFDAIPVQLEIKFPELKPKRKSLAI